MYLFFHLYQYELTDSYFIHRTIITVTLMHKLPLTVLVEVSSGCSCVLLACPIILLALLHFVSQLLYTCLATSWNQPFLQGVLIAFNCLVGFRNQDLCSRCTHIWSVSASRSSQLTETGNKCVYVSVYEHTFLGQEDPLEEGMAICSSILAWRIPMDRGAWQATVHRVAESDMTEAT